LNGSKPLLLSEAEDVPPVLICALTLRAETLVPFSRAENPMAWICPGCGRVILSKWVITG
jgi:hypothetical protein